MWTEIEKCCRLGHENVLDFCMKVNLREEPPHAEGEGDQERSQGVEEVLRGQPVLLQILKIISRGCESVFLPIAHFALTLPWMPSPVEAILDQRMLKASLLACRRAAATSSRALLAVAGS